MKIAVIGAGAIGSVAAAYLHKAGVDVCLIGRPAQVDEIKTKGLRVIGVRGEETIKVPVLPRLDKRYDLTIITVKTQDLEEAYQDNQRYLDEESLVLTTQNGVQADNIISTHLDKFKVVSSIVMFGSTYTKPGEVTFNFEGDWIIGKPFVVNDPFVWEVAEVLKKAFAVVVTQDIVGMKWLKLFVNFNNCIPALIGKSMQETFADKDLCRLSIMLLREGLGVVQKAGIEIVDLPKFPAQRILGLAAMPIDQAVEIIHKTLTTLSKEPLYGSILQSILRKRTSEIDFINGEVVLLAKNLQSEAPLNQRVIDMVHRVENSGKFFNLQEVKREFYQLSAASSQSAA